MKTFYRCVVRLLIVCLIGMGMPLPASAGIVTTEQASGAASARNQIKSFLARTRVRDELQKLGVDPLDAQARVNALTDQQAKQLAARIDELPAGGEVLGLLFMVFVILLVTDILGFTKVFPFTRPIKR